MGKAKRQVGMCEFMVYPNRGSGGYAGRVTKGDPYQCGRPAVVRRGGKNLCKRHDSEISVSDLTLINLIVDREEQWAEEREADQRRREERRQRQEERQAARAAAAAEWRRRNLTQCPQCGQLKRLATGRDICWACVFQERREQRIASFGSFYGRGMPLNRSEPHTVSAPEPEAKPLQEVFHGKRRFLKD